MTKTMVKALKPGFECAECGWTSAKWVGRCGECQQWGTVTEVGLGPAVASRIAPVIPLSPAVPIGQVDAAAVSHLATGIAEWDRVLGGGLVPGAVVLLTGEPGIGKSTLLLEVAARWSRRHGPALYVSGEESAGQVKLRALRTGAVSDDLYLAAETDLATVIGHVDQVEPSLLVVDSVQTIVASTVDGAPGGVAQVKEVATALIRQAKARDLPVILVGHVTKDGTVAGPRTLEHLVDVVASFEGDRHSGFRLVRATKNRYGAVDEVGCFELTDQGIAEVPDPSGVFLSSYAEPVPGSAVTVALEGRRPLVTEIQALVAPSALQLPRRVVGGLDSSRLAMVLAVAHRRAGLKLATLDVYASTVGGSRVVDPAADLALACALASASRDTPLPDHLVVIGEIGLAGEIRRVPDLAKRLAEAARLGVTSAVVPQGAEAEARRYGVMEVLEAPNLAYALNLLGLRGRG